MKKKAIVIPEDLGLYPDQALRLKKLGQLRIYHDTYISPEEWLKRSRNADIICAGKNGLKEKIYDLNNVFISVPFVAIDWIDKDKIKKLNVVVANSPGCNKHAVTEWIIGMMINLARRFHQNINTSQKINIEDREMGLFEKKVCILGKGNIGSIVGKVCESFGMKVGYFCRGDSLKEKTADSDFVIDCLGSNPSTYGLLNKKFFSSLKKGSYFITITGNKIVDYDAMIRSLDKGILSGVATDCGHIPVGKSDDDFYKKISSHPRILSTPHLAYRTDVTARIANDMMIDNIEAFLRGKPKNIVE